MPDEKLYGIRGTAVRILEYVTIKGRGVVAIVDVIPASLEIGMHVYVTEGSARMRARWKVSGIETHANIPQTRVRDVPGGLLLQGDDPLPEVGVYLEICP